MAKPRSFTPSRDPWGTWWVLDIGLAVYLPESHYYEDTPGFPVTLANRITARTVAQWATSFDACRMFYRADVREGDLPADSAARSTLVDELFAWFDGAQGEYARHELALRGDRDGPLLLDARVGFPAALYLDEDQFAALQDAWREAGLPTDLYYPNNQRRFVVEPVEHEAGGIYVRQARLYSPLRWAHRNHAAVEARPIADEEERRARFEQAAAEFRKALDLRFSELYEPGRPHTEETELISELSLWVTTAIEDQPDDYRRGSGLRPTAGWSEPPTALQALESALPTLRRRHPLGEVWELDSRKPLLDGRDRLWKLRLYDPDHRRSFEYTLLDGVVCERPNQWQAQRSSVEPGVDLRIVRCQDEAIPTLIDSDVAVKIADEAGGRAFREQRQPDYPSLRLQVHGREPVPTWMVAYHRRHPGRNFMAIIDAMTGGVIWTRTSEPPTDEIIISTE